MGILAILIIILLIIAAYIYRDSAVIGMAEIYNADEEKAVSKAKTAPVTIPPTKLSELADKLNYRDTITARSGKHFGQRKLLMSEVEFLNKYGHLSNEVVYAGAAPGIHIPLLLTLFPHKFHLYDPASFNNKLKKLPRIMIHSQLFGIDDAKKYRDKGVLFISDVRRVSKDFEAGVLDDLKIQVDWIQAIKPKAAMLKFRVPFNNKHMDYFDGDYYLQAWAPAHSTETRLIMDKKQMKLPFKRISEKEYESKLFYHNVVNRVIKTYKVPYGKEKNGEKVGNYDIAREAYIWKEYIDTTQSKKTVLGLINESDAYVQHVSALI